LASPATAPDRGRVGPEAPSLRTAFDALQKQHHPQPDRRTPKSPPAAAASTSAAIRRHVDRSRRSSAASYGVIDNDRKIFSTDRGRVHHISHPLAREALMIAGAGGAMRAAGWRATAIRFQQFGEGAAACSLSDISGWRAGVLYPLAGGGRESGAAHFVARPARAGAAAADRRRRFPF
jgi:hypothetical protein